MSIARGLRRLWRNEVSTLLTQAGSHEALFQREINGHPPGGALSPEAQDYFRRTKLPELGFRNYWYPVMHSRQLTDRPVKRRLLGEDIAFWRDGGKAYAIADRCPHRGASLADGHVRFPGSGTISCPYHGWTFDGTGQLRGCIQEGPRSVMPGKVRTQAYPVEDRLGVVWVWIGDLEPVPLEEDLPVAMAVPGVTNFIHFTKVWRTSWAMLFDNFVDGLHAPYLHRTSPQFLLYRLFFRTAGREPGFDAVEHDGKILEAFFPPPGGKGVDEVRLPGLGKFPRHKWWRRLPPRHGPAENFVPGFRPNSFLHGLPSYIHTVHEEQYFTQFIIPIDRDHLYSMCAMTGIYSTRDRLYWALYHHVYQRTHDTLFIEQDHRVLRNAKMGRERLSPWDQDVIRWRKFAVENARGYQAGAATPSAASTAPSHGDAGNGAPANGAAAARGAEPSVPDAAAAPRAVPTGRAPAAP